MVHRTEGKLSSKPFSDENASWLKVRGAGKKGGKAAESLFDDEDEEEEGEGEWVRACDPSPQHRSLRPACSRERRGMIARTGSRWPGLR